MVLVLNICTYVEIKDSIMAPKSKTTFNIYRDTLDRKFAGSYFSWVNNLDRTCFDFFKP